jgi:hypothetical protein
MPTRTMIYFQLVAKKSRFLVTFYLCDHHPLTLAVHGIFSGKNEIQIPSAMYLMGKTGDMAYNQERRTRTLFTEAKKRPLGFTSISRSFPGLGTTYNAPRKFHCGVQFVSV